MFEKFGQLAEQTATSVSRRQFLGRFGGSAMAVAAAVAGLLALPALGQAGGGKVCGLGSFDGCTGKKHGTPCVRSDGVAGRCKIITDSGPYVWCTCSGTGR